MLATAASSVVLAAAAQTSSTYDTTQLPSVRGTVAEYSLSPRGDVDGSILVDNTEVHLPPHLGAQLAIAVKPGDTVTVHGLRARAVPMVLAMAITNDATGSTVMDTGPGGGSQGGPSTRGAAGQDLTAQGKVRAQLHGPRGEPNGVLLENGSIVRLPVPEAQRLAGQLSPGTPLFAQSLGISGLLGRVIVANRIGSDPSQLTPVAVLSPPLPGYRPGGPGAPPPPAK